MKTRNGSGPGGTPVWQMPILGQSSNHSDKKFRNTFQLAPAVAPPSGPLWALVGRKALPCGKVRAEDSRAGRLQTERLENNKGNCPKEP